MFLKFLGTRMWSPFSVLPIFLSQIMVSASAWAMSTRPQLLQAAVRASEGRLGSHNVPVSLQHLAALLLAEVALLGAQMDTIARKMNEEPVLIGFSSFADSATAAEVDLPRAIRQWPPHAIANMVLACAHAPQLSGPIFKAGVTAAAHRSTEFTVLDFLGVFGSLFAGTDAPEPSTDEAPSEPSSTAEDYSSIKPTTSKAASEQPMDEASNSIMKQSAEEENAQLRAELTGILLPAAADHALEHLEEYSSLGVLADLVLVLGDNEYNAIWLLPAIVGLMASKCDVNGLDLAPDNPKGLREAIGQDKAILEEAQELLEATFKVWLGLSKLGYDDKDGADFMGRVLRGHLVPLMHRTAVHEAGHALAIKRMAVAGQNPTTDKGAASSDECDFDWPPPAATSTSTSPDAAGTATITMPRLEPSWSEVLEHVQILDLHQLASASAATRYGSNAGQESQDAEHKDHQADARALVAGATVPLENIRLSWHPHDASADDDDSKCQQQSQHPLVVFAPDVAGPLRLLESTGLVVLMDAQRLEVINSNLGHALVAAAGDMAEFIFYGNALQCSGPENMVNAEHCWDHDHYQIAALIRMTMELAFVSLDWEDGRMQMVFKTLFLAVLDNARQTLEADEAQLWELAGQLRERGHLTGEEIDELWLN